MSYHTDWFPPDAFPARPGVYQRDYSHTGLEPIHANDADLCWCFWDGVDWYGFGESPLEAAKNHGRSMIRVPWRGITLEAFTEAHRAFQALSDIYVGMR